MGEVYRAARGPDASPVAVKVIKPRFALERTAVRRFLHEARAAAEIEHEHLLGVIDTGEADGIPYLVMPYVEGRTLEQRLRAGETLTVEEANRMAAEVGSGLDALHAHGLVHRDIKASNIIFRTDGSAVLMDFGLAKGSGYSVLTTPGQLVGTLDYMAPELIRDQPATPSSDLYALGCVVYESLCGHPPFAGAGIFAVGMGHLERQPGDPCAGRADAAPGYGQAVLAALAKDPQARPVTAREYADRLTTAAHAPA